MIKTRQKKHLQFWEGGINFPSMKQLEAELKTRNIRYSKTQSATRSECIRIEARITSPLVTEIILAAFNYQYQ